MWRTSALVLSTAFLASTALAQDRWDGADDLDVNPLACDGGGGEVVAKDYDGGQPTGAPDLAGQEITLVDVPKLIGIGYFAATTQGMAEAADELGNVNVSTDGPTEANIDDQITFIDNYITQGVNGILFAANDPVAIAPVLKKALDKGIHVVGYDANSQPDAREWFVNQAEFNGIGKAMIDAIVAEIDEDGGFAIVTSTFTTPTRRAGSPRCGPTPRNAIRSWIGSRRSRRRRTTSCPSTRRRPCSTSTAATWTACSA